MSQSANNALALHEILLTIADSLNQAQNKLRNLPPYDEYGRPNPIYQLPYLDFNLEVVSEINTDSKSTANPPLNPNPLWGMSPLPVQLLKFKPATPSVQSTNNSNKITSNISGRFVAVLPNEGLPQVFLKLDAVEKSTLTYVLKVILSYATGEPVIGQTVEVNFDEHNSRTLNDGLELSAAPVFNPTKEGVTDENGIYETEVTIKASDVNKTIIFIANSGPIYSSVAISKD